MFVSGTTSSDENGRVVGGCDPHAQAVRVLEKIETALRSAGAELSDVVRTRIFVTDMESWEAVGRAHGEFFGEIRPAATLVQVNRLIEPGLLVEIEADAVVS